MTADTAAIAKPIDPGGELYQQRAFHALPILVRQALAARTIYYGELAHELGMPNVRNLNFVLGAVGASLQRLGKAWAEIIPPLQAVAVNRQSGLPGDGFTGFVPNPGAFKMAPTHRKKRIIGALLAEVYSYPRWLKVLEHFGAHPASVIDLAKVLPSSVRIALGSGGESDAHKQFKQFIASRPDSVGVTHRPERTEIEHVFPSSDAVDVLFCAGNSRVAVEVKARISSYQDLLRGIFQCVKYDALLKASLSVSEPDASSRVVLALEGALPHDLRSIANTLGVEVVDRIGLRS